MPALMRGSRIYGIHAKPTAKRCLNRPLLAYEHWGVMTWPVLLPKDHPFTKMRPEAISYDSFRNGILNDGEHRSLTGNGMCVHTVSSFFGFFLMGSSRRSPEYSRTGCRAN